MPAFQDETTPVRMLLKKNPNGDYIIIAVNMTSQSLHAIITLPNNLAPTDRIVEKFFEGNLQTLAGGINDLFGPFGVHIYKISAASPGEGSSGGRLRSNKAQPAAENRLEGSHSVDVYPNPSDASFTFGIMNGSIAEISIYNTSGQVVVNKKFSDPESTGILTIDLSPEHAKKPTPGMYFYRLTTNDKKVHSGRLIVR